MKNNVFFLSLVFKTNLLNEKLAEKKDGKLTSTTRNHMQNEREDFDWIQTQFRTTAANNWHFHNVQNGKVLQEN